jgi:hypothetical protein
MGRKTGERSVCPRISFKKEGMLAMKTIFSSVIQARRLLLFVLLFVVSLLGGFVAIACDSADYTVVKSAKSPDGNLSALLVQRRAHGPLSSDVYYVIMTDNQHEIPNLSTATHDNPVLVATHGQDLGVHWSGANAMDIICARCGMRPIDIIEKKGSFGSVSITYLGFPNGTATP